MSLSRRFASLLAASAHMAEGMAQLYRPLSDSHPISFDFSSAKTIFQTESLMSSSFIYPCRLDRTSFVLSITSPPQPVYVVVASDADKVFFPDPGFLSADAEELPFLDFKDGRVYAVYSYLLFFHIFSGSIAGMSGTRSKKGSSSPSAFRRERRWESSECSTTKGSHCRSHT